MSYRRIAGRHGRLTVASCLFAVLFLLGAAPPRAWADDDIKAKIAAAGDAAKHNADSVVVLDETDVTVRPSGIGTARVTSLPRSCATPPFAACRCRSFRLTRTRTGSS